jgi:hypothetical protein
MFGRHKLRLCEACKFNYQSDNHDYSCEHGKHKLAGLLHLAFAVGICVTAEHLFAWLS